MSDSIINEKFKRLPEPRIERISSRKLVGKYLEMRLAGDRTAELWKSFMPQRNLIKNTIGNDLYSLQVYTKIPDLKYFTTETVFIKWAAVEVTDFEAIPDNMSEHVLPEGLYAVFSYKGLPAEFKDIFLFIFGSWIPKSEYEIDNRDHFEILGSKYKNNDPDSEEDIFIPIKKR